MYIIGLTCLIIDTSFVIIKVVASGSATNSKGFFRLHRGFLHEGISVHIHKGIPVQFYLSL